MGRPTYIKINGKTVQGEWLEPEEQPFIANPRVQNTAMFMAGLGLQGMRFAKALAGATMNPPNADRVQRSLPWAALTALGLFIAPTTGIAKPVVQIVSALFGLKAVNELVRKPDVVTQQKGSA